MTPTVPVPPSHIREVLTIHIQRGDANTFYATCDQHTGLLTSEQTLSATLASIVPALGYLLSAGPPHPDPHAFEGVEVS